MNELTHIDKNGNPKMVDVTDKGASKRMAIASCIVTLGSEILSELDEKEIKTKKGPVFQTAIIAGTMAVKKTSDLIPMCHPLPITGCDFNIEILNDQQIEINCRVSCTGQTGVEMEALTGVSVAALTVYDMCKAMSHEIEIGPIRLIEKKGGKLDYVRK